jgi:hypothetical protein
MTIEERLARIEAIEEIRRLMWRYTWALDHADFPGIVACYWPEGAFGFQDASWVGSAAIEDYFRKDRLSHPEMLHYPVNIVVDVQALDEADGSGTAIADSTLWDLFNRNTGEGPQGSVLAGWYRAFVSRHNGEWRFDRLQVTGRWVVPQARPWAMSGSFAARPEDRPE